MEPKPLDVLVRAKALLEKPGAWIRNYLYAHKGVPLYANERPSEFCEAAGEYCAYGALYKARHELGGSLPASHFVMWGQGTQALPEAVLLERARDQIAPEYANAAEFNNKNEAGLAGVQKLFCKAID